MAKLVLTNSIVTLSGTDISTNVASVTLQTSVNEVETTAMGAGGVTRVGGLRDDSITLDIHQDFSSVEALVWPLLGSTATIVVKPNGTTVSSTNPSYTGTVLINDWSPISGAVGELATVSVTWPISGTVTRATS